RNPMFTGLLEVGFLGAAIAFNGEARLRSTKAEHVLDVVRIQGGFTTTKMPAHQLYRKSAAKNDSRGFGIAPDVVFGGGRHVAFATRGAAITTQRPTLEQMPGLRCKARATFVSGPSVTKTRPGLDSIVAMMASAAFCFSGALFGEG